MRKDPNGPDNPMVQWSSFLTGAGEVCGFGMWSGHFVRRWEEEKEVTASFRSFVALLFHS